MAFQSIQSRILEQVGNLATAAGLEIAQHQDYANIGRLYLFKKTRSEPLIVVDYDKLRISTGGRIVPAGVRSDGYFYANYDRPSSFWATFSDVLGLIP